MGNVTVPSGIWTPDEDEAVDPEVWSAGMAQSIEDGLGVRMTAQEAVVGLKASISTLTYVQNIQPFIAPFTTGEEEDFVTGMEFTGGVATIITPGIYGISACATLDPVRFFAGNAGRSITIELRKNGTIFRRCETESSALFWQTASADSPIQCVAGDKLSVTWYSANEAGDSPGAAPGARLAIDTGLNSFSIMLNTPTG